MISVDVFFDNRHIGSPSYVAVPRVGEVLLFEEGQKYRVQEVIWLNWQSSPQLLVGLYGYATFFSLVPTPSTY